MKKIGLFYATKADKTTWVAEKIQKEFGKDRIEVVPIEQAWQNDFAAYDCLIVGASTWFDGELPTYWDELLPELRTLDLKGKKVAVFGLGDQIRYPENFADGIGLLAEVFEGDGATLVGFTSSERYTFERSRALRGDRWCGLVVDLDYQSEQAEKRIREWCEQVKNEFCSKPYTLYLFPGNITEGILYHTILFIKDGMYQMSSRTLLDEHLVYNKMSMPYSTR